LLRRPRLLRYLRWRNLNFDRSLIPRFRQRPGCLAAYVYSSHVARIDDLERAKELGQIDHVVRG
jgi:hypothetical protein